MSYIDEFYNYEDVSDHDIFCSVKKAKDNYNIKIQNEDIPDEQLEYNEY